MGQSKPTGLGLWRRVTPLPSVGPHSCSQGQLELQDQSLSQFIWKNDIAVRFCEETEGWQGPSRMLRSTNLLETQKLEPYPKRFAPGTSVVRVLTLPLIFPPQMMLSSVLTSPAVSSCFTPALPLPAGYVLSALCLFSASL